MSTRAGQRERRGAARRPLWRLPLDAFFWSVRWLRGHVDTLYGALGLYFVVVLAAALLALAAFAEMAELVQEGQTQALDERVMLWVNTHRSPALDRIALEVTSLGSAAVVWMVVLVASAFLWMSHHRYSVLLLAVAVLGSGILNQVLKALFDRPRPQVFEWVTPHVGSASFPSGHAMTSMVVYATVAYLIVRLEPKVWMRRATLLLAAVVVFLIGLSRIYLGVHYPSDVVAGFAGGFAWATACAFGIEVVRVYRGRSAAARSDEHGLARGTKPIREALGQTPRSRAK